MKSTRTHLNLESLDARIVPTTVPQDFSEALPPTNPDATSYGSGSDSGYTSADTSGSSTYDYGSDSYPNSAYGSGSGSYGTGGGIPPSAYGEVWTPSGGFYPNYAYGSGSGSDSTVANDPYSNNSIGAGSGVGSGPPAIGVSYAVNAVGGDFWSGSGSGSGISYSSGSGTYSPSGYETGSDTHPNGECDSGSGSGSGSSDSPTGDGTTHVQMMASRDGHGSALETGLGSDHHEACEFCVYIDADWYATFADSGFTCSGGGAVSAIPSGPDGTAGSGPALGDRLELWDENAPVDTSLDVRNSPLAGGPETVSLLALTPTTILAGDPPVSTSKGVPSDAITNSQLGTAGAFLKRAGLIDPSTKNQLYDRLGEILAKTVVVPPKGPGTAVSGGTHSGVSDLANGTFFGTSGAGPCIAVMMTLPGGKGYVVFHFAALDDAADTMSNYKWPEGTTAVVVGGTTDNPSRRTLAEVIQYLKNNDIKSVGVRNATGVWVDSVGTIHVMIENK